MMYMAMCLLTGTSYTKVDDYGEYANRMFKHDILKPLRYLKKVNPEAYAYAIKTDEIMIDR